MNSTNACLSESEISRLLSTDTPSTETAEAELHLAECGACRSTIETMIADSRWWDEAEQTLATSAIWSTVRENAAREAEPSTNVRMLELLGPTDDPAMLGRVGAYEIIGILGFGGMGVVFKGHDGALNRYVAIKMLLPHLAVSGAARKRFAREGLIR